MKIKLLLRIAISF